MKTLPTILTTTLLAAGASHAAALAYSETFNNTGTGSLSIGSKGWSAAFGDGDNVTTPGAATAYDNTSASSAVSPTVPSAASGGGDDSNPAVGTANGYLFTDGARNFSDAHLWYVDSLSLGSVADFDRIEFDLRNTSITDNIQPAIQVAGSWFVATSSYNNTTSGVWTDNLSTTGTTWAPLTFTLGQPFEVGAVAPLPATGTITGVGFYDSFHSNSFRLDNVEVWVVPEPSTSFLAGATALLFAFRRKR